MAKKCKFCSTTMINGDKHSCCLQCRTDKHGDDLCVQGKNCKHCEQLLRIPRKSEEREKTSDKRREMDDRLLDDDTSSGVVGSAGPDLLASITALTTQISQLTQKVQSLEEKGGGATATVIADPSTSQTASNASQSTATEREPVPVDAVANSDEEGEVKSSTDKEPDPTYIEM